jgi:hypothetical protein
MISSLFYTYVYYDPSRNNEPIYVGKGKGRRVWSHMQSHKKHPFVQRLQKMKRLNISPVIGIYAGFDEEFAHFLETILISKFGRKDLKLGTLLNLTDGGDGPSGRIYSDGYKAMQSSRLKGIPKPESSKRYGKDNHNYGRPLSASHKQKISNSTKGVPKSEDFKNNLRGKKHPNRKLQIVECPYCKRTGSILIFHRWHFDKCKHKDNKND